jgi:hypothetical protein
LLYLLEIGSVEQNIIKQAIRFGQPIPERIANAPKLRQGLQLYMQAFFELDTERSIGMAVGRIPWTSIIDYAKAYEFSEEQTADFVYFIRAMDNAHLKHLDEKREK